MPSDESDLPIGRSGESGLPVEGSVPDGSAPDGSASASAVPDGSAADRPATDSAAPDVAGTAEAAAGDEPATGESSPAQTKTPVRHRPWWRWLRWAAVVLIVTILIVELVLVWPSLTNVWHRSGEFNWWWLGAAFLAAMLSMDSYAQVQRVLLRSAGVKVKQTGSLAVILASNSISQTMPGGQVLSPAFIYRETRKWGATPAVASWQLVMSGLLAGVGLAVLGLGGALLAGAQTSPFSIIFSIAGFILFVIVMQYLASHPESAEGVGIRVLAFINKLREKPLDHGTERLHRVLFQLQAVRLGRRDASEAFGWSLFNWVADIACLAFVCWAIGAEPGLAGLMVAYAAAKAVGSTVPLLPGGIGVVEAVLVPALISAGMPQADAWTVMILYRVISYVLVAAIGWVVIAVRYRSVIGSRDKLRTQMEQEEETEELEERVGHDSPGTAEPPPRGPAAGPDGDDH